MNEIFIIAADYLKGKTVYPTFRRMLNLLFNISIASFLYEKCYGKYIWLNYNDYKGIFDFFIKGNFFIPFSIFVVVYSVTQFLSIAIFFVINHFKSLKVTRKILQYQFEKETVDKELDNVTRISDILIPESFTKDKMLSLYLEFRNQLTPEAFSTIEKELKEPKLNLQNNFTLAFRMVIAISIYFFSLPQFGRFLYVTIMIILLIGMYVLMISYQFLNILPTLIKMFHFQAEEYLKSLNQNDGESSL